MAIGQSDIGIPGTLPESQIPTGVPQLPPSGAGGGTIAQPQQGGDLVSQLTQILNQNMAQTVQRATPVMPQYQPKQFSAGDVSNMYVNPNQPGGPAHNARISLANAIGSAVSGAMNQAEQKKAQNIAFDMQRLSMAMQNPTPENKAMAEEILSDPKKRKDIASTMNISFMGDDKRKPYQKIAGDIFHRRQVQDMQQKLQQQQQQIQQQEQQKLTPYFDQLSKMMPQTLQMSPELMMRAELIKAGIQPTAGEELRSLTSVYGTQSRADIWQQRLGFEGYKAALYASIKNEEIGQKEDHDKVLVDIANAHDKNALQRAMIGYQGQQLHAWALMGAAELRVRSAEKLQSDKYNVENMSHSMTESINAYRNENSSLAQERTAQVSIAKSVLKSSADKKAALAKIKDIDAQVTENNDSIKKLADGLQYVTPAMNNINQALRESQLNQPNRSTAFGFPSSPFGGISMPQQTGPLFPGRPTSQTPTPAQTTPAPTPSTLPGATMPSDTYGLPQDLLNDLTSTYDDDEL